MPEVVLAAAAAKVRAGAAVEVVAGWRIRCTARSGSPRSTSCTT